MSDIKVTFKGEPVEVRGNTLNVGDTMPDFVLTGLDMRDVLPTDFSDKTLVISVVPSLDTPVCSNQTKRFAEEATKLGPQVVILTVSRDLPFAQKRWCGAEGVEHMAVASDYKYQKFGEQFGVFLPSLGILARAVFVVDKSRKITHVQYVGEIAEEPDYAAVLNALQGS